MNPYEGTPAKILAITRQTATDWTFRLACPHTPQPGQFFEVSLPRVGEGPISICGLGDGFVEMTIRRVGKVTAAIFDLYEGDTLYLRGPYGHGFDLPNYNGKHLVVLAGGTGLAPVRGVIQHFVARRGQLKAFDVVLGFKSPGDILFRSEIDQWAKGADVRITVDKADETWAGPVGVITTLLGDVPMPQLADVSAIVVGPPAMMKFCLRSLLDRGLSPEQIWVSYERRMSCGLGKCGHCKINGKYVCLDGPVFNYTQAQWLVD